MTKLKSHPKNHDLRHNLLLRSNFKNTCTMVIISIIALELIVAGNLYYAHADTGSNDNQETTGQFTITQQGLIKPIRIASGPGHDILLNMSGIYTLDAGVVKINLDSLFGTLVIDGDNPIPLDITKISVYKNLKTIFYKAKTTNVNNISGKLKFTNPLDFEESDNPSTITGSYMSLTMNYKKYYSEIEGEMLIEPSQISPLNMTTQVIASTGCDKSLWDHIYHPNRLQIVQDCITVTGTIEKSTPEGDGDYHIRVKLDSHYSNLINSDNDDKQHGDLVVEPICQHKVTQVDAVSACTDFNKHIDIPPVGTHVKITGSYVLDLQHGGWAEIHPVSNLTVD